MAAKKKARGSVKKAQPKKSSPSTRRESKKKEEETPMTSSDKTPGEIAKADRADDNKATAEEAKKTPFKGRFAKDADVKYQGRPAIVRAVTEGEDGKARYAVEYTEEKAASGDPAYFESVTDDELKAL